MQTLQELCLLELERCHCESDENGMWYLDTEYEERFMKFIREREKVQLCKTDVRSTTTRYDSEIEDYYFGYIDGLNSVLQQKHYYQINFVSCISYARRRIYNCGIIPSRYVLYYLKQDADFKSWYAPLYARRIDATAWIPDTKRLMSV